jgi:hypothetical protein
MEAVPAKIMVIARYAGFLVYPNGPSVAMRLTDRRGSTGVSPRFIVRKNHAPREIPPTTSGHPKRRFSSLGRNGSFAFRFKRRLKISGTPKMSGGGAMTPGLSFSSGISFSFPVGGVILYAMRVEDSVVRGVVSRDAS